MNKERFKKYVAARIAVEARAASIPSGELRSFEREVCLHALAFLPAVADLGALEFLSVWHAPNAGGFTLRELGIVAWRHLNRLCHVERHTAWDEIRLEAEDVLAEGTDKVRARVYLDRLNTAAKRDGECIRDRFAPPLPPRHPDFRHVRQARNEWIWLLPPLRPFSAFPDAAAVERAIEAENARLDRGPDHA